MRQLIVQVPAGRGQEVLDIAQGHGGTNLVRLAAEGSDGPAEIAIVHAPNASIGALLDDLERISPLRVSFAPQGVLALKPPPDAAPQQVADVTARSSIEIFLAGIQSVGSWKGFLGYAVAAGGVVWIGLLTNTVYLLTAAMLIAPFAGPAMNAAVATARGDARLLGRSLLRYFASLLVTIVTAALLSLLFRLEAASEQMVAASILSSTAVLLPLIAGAAGALNLVQSERSSLVSGAATGMLVAASLAPPAGLIGMAAVIGRWEMALGGFFVLLLQIAGINVAGALVFRAFGLAAHGPRYARGRRWIYPTALALTVCALAALLFWQFGDQPQLQRASREQRAAAVVAEAIESSGVARLVDAEVRFPRPRSRGQPLLVLVYVQAAGNLGKEELGAELRRRIGERLRARFEAEPLVEVTVLAPATAPP